MIVIVGGLFLTHRMVFVSRFKGTRAVNGSVGKPYPGDEVRQDLDMPRVVASMKMFSG